MQQPKAPAQDTDDRSRWTALYVLCTGVLMIVLDATVVNVALPAIQDDLGFSPSSLAWVVNAYLIAFGGLLLLSGRLGDLLGRRDLFLVGLTLFTTASLLCGFAQNEAMLIAARFLQGIGGALTSAVVLGMIVTMFPKPSEQAKAIGVFAFVASAGGSVGLLAGGILTQALSWHWIFFINVPIGIFTGIAARRLIEKDEGIGFGKGADVPGAVLITSALMLAVFTIVSPAEERGWGDPLTLGLMAGAFVLIGLFVLRERSAAHPLVPLAIFRSRNLTGANLIQMLSIAGMFGMFFLGVLYLQRILGYDELETGLAFLPLTLVMGTLSVRFAEPLIMRFGARRLLFPGLTLIALGLVLLTRAPVDGSYVEHILPCTLLFALGAGICFPGLMTLAMSGAGQENAGLASGLINTSAQVGGAIGLALLATFAATRTESLIAEGTGRAEALVSGYHLAFWIAAALVAASIVVALVVAREDPDGERQAIEEGELDGAELVYAEDI